MPTRIKCTRYQVVAYGNLGMSVTFDRLSACAASSIKDILSHGFRDIRIIDGETGEIMYNHYLSEDWFTRTSTEEDSISMAKSFLANR
jgi:hypothetical protein